MLYDFRHELSVVAGTAVHPQVSQSGSGNSPVVSEGGATYQTQQALTGLVGSQVKDLSTRYARLAETPMAGGVTVQDVGAGFPLLVFGISKKLYVEDDE